MAKSGRFTQDPSLLEAALEGLMLQKQRLEAQIGEVRALLGKRRANATNTAGQSASHKKRELSPSARKRIAAAQKKRWAEYRKSKPAKD
jgi:hypothetical protein